jgi:2'-5' RNA ligase
VLWVGVQERGEQLAHLQRDVERAIVPLGYPADRRGFHPHLTLGRIKAPRNAASRSAASRPNRQKAAELDALGAYVERAKVRVGHLRVEAVHLMRSELLPGGAVYSEIAACPLAGHG